MPFLQPRQSRGPGGKRGDSSSFDTQPAVPLERLIGASAPEYPPSLRSLYPLRAWQPLFTLHEGECEPRPLLGGPELVAAGRGGQRGAGSTSGRTGRDSSCRHAGEPTGVSHTLQHPKDGGQALGIFPFTEAGRSEVVPSRAVSQVLVCTKDSECHLQMSHVG